MATLRDALKEAIARLETAGVETPRLDGEVLLAHVLGRNRAYLYAHLPDALTPELQQHFELLVTRREGREPLPYLLGEWEFMGLRLSVSPAVLIPRPETETLVEEAAKRLPSDARLLDVGTGSGCIAIGLAQLLPRAEILALDASAEALDVARENLARHGIADRVRLIHGAFPEAAREFEALDGIVSNPPYIPSEEVERLEPELREHEPRLALDGGLEGFSVLLPLAREGAGMLKPGGLLAVEVAKGQAERVAELLRQAGCWTEAEIIPDLGGIPRVVIATTLPTDDRGRSRA